MGQTNSTETASQLRKLEEGWKPHPFEKDVFCHPKTKMQVQRYVIIPTEREKKFFLKRAREHHAHILKVVHCENVFLARTAEKKQEGMVIHMEKMRKLLKKDWKSTQTALSILKGFRRLSSTFGFFQITKGMMGINAEGEPKLWIHEIPVISEPECLLESEEEMLEGLAKIIMEGDPETGMLLAGATTFNEGINNILLDLSRKTLNTTNRNKFSSQIKNKAKSKGSKGIFQNKKLSHDKSALLSSKRLVKNEEKSKKNFPPFIDKNSKNSYNLQITDFPQTKQNPHLQSQKQIHPAYYPLPSFTQVAFHEETQKVAKENIYAHQRNRHSSNDLSDDQKLHEAFNRFQTHHFDKLSYPYPSHEIKNDLKKMSIKKIGNRKCSFQNERREPKVENSIFEEDEEEDNPKITTTPEFKGTSFTEEFFNPGRKQEIGLFVIENMKKVPQTNHSTMEKTQIFNQSNEQKQEEKTDEDRSFEEKRQLKQNLNRKIRIQMKDILDLGEEKNKEDEKSMKDLWIRQKINKKKQNFAELKKEALKLLQEQFSI